MQGSVPFSRIINYSNELQKFKCSTCNLFNENFYQCSYCKFYTCQNCYYEHNGKCSICEYFTLNLAKNQDSPSKIPLFKCSNYENGCQEYLEFTQIQEHEKNCDKALTDKFYFGESTNSINFSVELENNEEIENEVDPAANISLLFNKSTENTKMKKKLRKNEIERFQKISKKVAKFKKENQNNFEILFKKIDEMKDSNLLRNTQSTQCSDLEKNNELNILNNKDKVVINDKRINLIMIMIILTIILISSISISIRNQTAFISEQSIITQNTIVNIQKKMGEIEAELFNTTQKKYPDLNLEFSKFNENFQEMKEKLEFLNNKDNLNVKSMNLRRQLIRQNFHKMRRVNKIENEVYYFISQIVKINFQKILHELDLENSINYFIVIKNRLVKIYSIYDHSNPIFHIEENESVVFASIRNEKIITIVKSGKINTYTLNKNTFKKSITEVSRYLNNNQRKIKILNVEDNGQKNLTIFSVFNEVSLKKSVFALKFDNNSEASIANKIFYPEHNFIIGFINNLPHFIEAKSGIMNVTELLSFRKRTYIYNQDFIPLKVIDNNIIGKIKSSLYIFNTKLSIFYCLDNEIININKDLGISLLVKNVNKEGKGLLGLKFEEKYYFIKLE